MIQLNKRILMKHQGKVMDQYLGRRKNDMAISALLDQKLDIPASITAVFTHFLTCEMTTIGKSGRPITWPLMPLYWGERSQFVLFTSIGLPQKAFNVRHNPRVSLLFSDPTGSGLTNPPTVLVQGDAAVSDQLIASFDGLEPELLELLKTQAIKMLMRQPAMKMYINNPLSRYLMDWYFMRLVITFTPRWIQWWENGDYSRTANVQEVNHVV